MSDKFGAAFDAHMKRIYAVASKLQELEAFHSQWADLFTLLSKKTGNKDCAVKVSNNLIFDTYIYDKIHILVTDLFALMGDQLTGQFSIFKESKNYLKILGESDYYDPAQTLNIMSINRVISDEEMEARREEYRRDRAKQAREIRIEKIKLLFPALQSPFQISDQDVEALIERVKSLTERLRNARTFFSHKHESVIANRCLKKGDFPDLKTMREIFDEYCKLIGAIGLIHHDASYPFDLGGVDYSGTAIDAIDLILFGSINRALAEFGLYEDRDASQGPVWYWEARQAFFESDKVLELIAREKGGA